MSSTDRPTLPESLAQHLFHGSLTPINMRLVRVQQNQRADYPMMNPMTADAPFALTTQQKNFFETFGYLKLPGLLADVIGNIGQHFDKLFIAHNPEVVDWLHEAHYMKSRFVLMHFIEREPELASLLEDPRIHGLFLSLLGKDYQYRASDANIFTGDTYWHSDLYGAFFKYRHVKILTYLDPLDGNSGAFRAIPGSHLFGDKFANKLENFVWKHEENYGLHKDEVPSVTVPTVPGDVLVFDYRLKHATSYTTFKRRMFTICGSEAFAEEDMPTLQKLTSELLPIAGGQVFLPEFVANAPASRQKHLEQSLRAFAQLQAGNAGKPVA